MQMLVGKWLPKSDALFVFDFGGEPKVFVLEGPLTPKLLLQPCVYSALPVPPKARQNSLLPWREGCTVLRMRIAGDGWQNASDDRANFMLDVRDLGIQ